MEVSLRLPLHVTEVKNQEVFGIANDFNLFTRTVALPEPVAQHNAAPGYSQVLFHSENTELVTQVMEAADPAKAVKLTKGAWRRVWKLIL